MRRISRIIIALMIVSLPWEACARNIFIAGSSTVHRYIALAATAYHKQNPLVSFHIDVNGSDIGIALAKQRKVHIGMTSRELSAREQTMLTDFRIILIGYDAVVPIVSDEIFHPGNVSAISPEELAAVYRGEITNWKSLGGPDRPILLIEKPSYSGTHQTFAQYILGSKDARAKNAVLLEDNLNILHLIQASDQALGYLSFTYANESAHALALQLKNDIVQANLETITAQRYPMSRKLYLIVAKDAPSYVQDFVRFLSSATGQVLLKKSGYLPVKKLPETGQQIGGKQMPAVNQHEKNNFQRQ